MVGGLVGVEKVDAWVGLHGGFAWMGLRWWTSGSVAYQMGE